MKLGLVYNTLLKYASIVTGVRLICRNYDKLLEGRRRM